MVCTGFNADFDGDQMAVHVPLSEKAIEEAKEKMMTKSNILLMADGNPVVNVEKDMALGIYFLTVRLLQKQNGILRLPTEAIGRYESGIWT